MNHRIQSFNHNLSFCRHSTDDILISIPENNQTSYTKVYNTYRNRTMLDAERKNCCPSWALHNERKAVKKRLPKETLKRISYLLLHGLHLHSIIFTIESGKPSLVIVSSSFIFFFFICFLRSFGFRFFCRF